MRKATYLAIPKPYYRGMPLYYGIRYRKLRINTDTLKASYCDPSKVFLQIAYDSDFGETFHEFNKNLMKVINFSKVEQFRQYDRY